MTRTNVDRFDGLLIVGGALIAIGCAMVAVPLGLMVAGAGCIAIAVIGARSSAARNNTPPARKDKA